MAASKQLTPKPNTLPRKALTSAEFAKLSDVSPETEWIGNIHNPLTRAGYRNDLKEFMFRLAQGLGPPQTRTRIHPAEDIGDFLAV